MYASNDAMKNKQAPMSALPTTPVTASDMREERKKMSVIQKKTRQQIEFQSSLQT